MNVDFLADVAIGLYLGILTAIFPALIAFALGFIFKYVTGVTVPGLGVVVLGGGLAGISGGLLGLLDPTVAGTPVGIVALLVVLMVCLWAHSIGDTLGASVPRRLTLAGLRERGLSPDLVDRIDRFGQIQLRPIGEVRDVEGFQPLPEDVREKLRTDSWTLPADRPLDELESLLAERIASAYDLAEVTVSIDRRGHVELAAAPTSAGLSRSIPPGNSAVTVRTVLPTGLSRGDDVALAVDDGAETFVGAVVGARTDGGDGPGPGRTADRLPPDDGVSGGPSGRGDGESAIDITDGPRTAPRLGSATGGTGDVTVSLPATEARRLLRYDVATLTVRARGTNREYALVGRLRGAGNRFERVVVGAGSPLDGVSIGEAAVRDAYEVAILSIARAHERIVEPDPSVELGAGDDLTVAGPPGALDRFREAVE